VAVYPNQCPKAVTTEHVDTQPRRRRQDARRRVVNEDYGVRAIVGPLHQDYVAQLRRVRHLAANALPGLRRSPRLQGLEKVACGVVAAHAAQDLSAPVEAVPIRVGDHTADQI